MADAPRLEKRDVAAGRLSPEDYAAGFADLHPGLDANAARIEAERCLFCYDAPCASACPTSIDIPLFIRQIAKGQPKPAAKTILDQNIMGAMCARVCPTETLCEEVCVRHASDGAPVRIGQLQRFATDALFAAGAQPYRRGAPTDRRIAVVGAGPAGLACAHALARAGHEVVVFEAREKPGGLNEYGIAAYKAVDGVAQAEVDFILGVGGIELKTGAALGRDVSLAGLRDQFDAVFLGMGLGGVNALGIEADKGGEDAVSYIAGLRQAGDLASLPVGRRVVVIGGGMTAIDVAVQTKRLGAEEVTVVYRRGAVDMGASEFEQELALTDGVTIRCFAKPVAVSPGSATFEKTEVVEGRLIGTGEIFELPYDQLFRAIGQTLVADGLDGAIMLESGRIKVDAERRTSLSGVWAGGDCIAGGQDLTVAAVEDGKRAAASIDRALRAELRPAE
ncbi:NAD(P)-dependent oxidoreductase [Methylopila sp. M107]|uniref:NAD(P)-dependent oxidoreductase n=1 Tax=Methylopila sp. M107 TaxID=1101190 RepID=UPI000364282D|nr:NAD(P)-dependent oxidoreductase [Methylopila sp. M107]